MSEKKEKRGEKNKGWDKWFKIRKNKNQGKI